MATFQAASLSVAVDMAVQFFPFGPDGQFDIDDITVNEQGATDQAIVLDLATSIGDLIVAYIGPGPFTDDASDIPATGTFTAMTVAVAGTTIGTISGITRANNFAEIITNDNYRILFGDDDINGSNQDDSLFGGDGGNDTIDAKSGNDTILLTVGNGAPPTHFVKGGAGTDTITAIANFYSNATALDLTNAIVQGIEAVTIFGGLTVRLSSSQLSATNVSLSSAITLGSGTAATFHVVKNLAGKLDLSTLNVGGGIAVLVDGTDRADSIFGTAVTDTLRGGLGKDLLNGVAGADKLFGGGGDDVYVIQSDDAVTETGRATRGVDTIRSVSSINLGTAAHGGGNVENAVALANNSLRGNGLNNVLDGASVAGGSANALFGLGGNDTYIVGAGDAVSEAGGGGTDTVQTGAFSISLAAFAGIENATLTGNGAFNLTGNAGANVLTGNGGANRITGGGGADTMSGWAGAVRDVFDFNAVAEMGKTAATRDKIIGFQPTRDDIDLSTIDANGAAAGSKFKFLAAEGAAFTGVKGQLRWFQENPAGSANDRTIIVGDINGDTFADFQIELTGLKTLTIGDFIL